METETQAEVNRLNAIKQRIRTNLVAQGIPVPEDTKLEAMAEHILSVAGEDGKTPVRGVDYYTDADKAEFSAYIANELAKRNQTQLEFVGSVEEMTDTTKLYVMNGYIWACMYTEVEVGGYNNLADPESSDWNASSRYNASGAITSCPEAGAFVSNMFPCKAGDVLRIKGVKRSESTAATAAIFVAARLLEDGTNSVSAHTIYLSEPLGTSVATNRKAWDACTTDANGVITWTFALNNAGTNTAGATVVNTRIAGIATDGVENIIITVNEEIVEPEIKKEYQWVNTGHAFAPAEYEDRIIKLEKTVKALKSSGMYSGARWFALGDSITQGYASVVDTSASSGYKQFLNTNEAERWVNIVADMNGYELTNYGAGGTGYAHSSNNVRKQVASIDFSQCDFVTLAYGVNDWKGKATLGSMDDDVDTVDAFVPNMRYAIKKILADNPYCKIFVITPLNCRSLGYYDTNWGIGYTNSEVASGPGLEQIFQLEKTVCEYHGIELIDMTHCSIINRENIKTMLPDYVHPTVECHRMMARELAQKITFR